MLKGLVTLTNSVICPLSYNCMCSSCFGGGTAGQLWGHLLFGAPAKSSLPGATSSRAGAERAQGGPGAPSGLGQQARVVRLLLCSQAPRALPYPWLPLHTESVPEQPTLGLPLFPKLLASWPLPAHFHRDRGHVASGDLLSVWLHL